MGDTYNVHVHATKLSVLDAELKEIDAWHCITIRVGDTIVQSLGFPRQDLDRIGPVALLELASGIDEEGTGWSIIQRSEENADGITVSGTYRTWASLYAEGFASIADTPRTKPLRR